IAVAVTADSAMQIAAVAA
ncbi:hypothetical protein A2U01_0102657, partial [Trifolium medium]|nr:hypothetical protein [Trifolium medium]